MGGAGKAFSSLGASRTQDPFLPLRGMRPQVLAHLSRREALGAGRGTAYWGLRGCDLCWLPGAGLRDEMADQGTGQERSVSDLDWGALRSGPTPAGHGHAHPLIVHSVVSTRQNSRASGGFLSEQVLVPSGPRAERGGREQGLAGREYRAQCLRGATAPWTGHGDQELQLRGLDLPLTSCVTLAKPPPLSGLSSPNTKGLKQVLPKFTPRFMTPFITQDQESPGPITALLYASTSSQE